MKQSTIIKISGTKSIVIDRTHTGRYIATLQYRYGFGDGYAITQVYSDTSEEEVVSRIHEAEKLKADGVNWKDYPEWLIS